MRHTNLIATAALIALALTASTANAASGGECSKWQTHVRACQELTRSGHGEIVVKYKNERKKPVTVEIESCAVRSQQVSVIAKKPLVIEAGAEAIIARDPDAPIIWGIEMAIVECRYKYAESPW